MPPESVHATMIQLIRRRDRVRSLSSGLRTVQVCLVGEPVLKTKQSRVGIEPGGQAGRTLSAQAIPVAA